MIVDKNDGWYKTDQRDREESKTPQVVTTRIFIDTKKKTKHKKGATATNLDAYKLEPTFTLGSTATLSE